VFIQLCVFFVQHYNSEADIHVCANMLQEESSYSDTIKPVNSYYK